MDPPRRSDEGCRSRSGSPPLRKRVPEQFRHGHRGSPGIDGQLIYKTLREKYGITGAGGQDQAKGRIFRLAHLGYADSFDVITGIAALEMVLKGLGHPVTLGKGVGAAQEALMQ